MFLARILTLIELYFLSQSDSSALTLMHPHLEPHVFAPLPTRPLTFLEMGHWDRNIQRRSSSLHVFIAWRIYYHKQIKTIIQKSNGLPQDVLLNYPITSLPDPKQPKEPQPSFKHPYLDSAFKSIGRIEKQANISHSCYSLLEPRPSKPSSHQCGQKHHGYLSRDKVGQPVKKMDLERHESCKTNTALSLAVWDRSWDPRRIHILDGTQSNSKYNKRHLEGCSFEGVKRQKQEMEDKQLDPLLFTAPYTDSYTNKTKLQQLSVSSLCASCGNGCRCNISYPGTELHPYQTASWEQTWSKAMDGCLRHELFRQFVCDRFQRFLLPRVCSPVVLRCQDGVYLRDQERLPSFLSLP